MLPSAPKRKPQHFFGGGLAGAAGDADDLRMAARARGSRQILQPALRVGDRQQRAARIRVLRRWRDQRRRRLRLQSGVDEIVPIARVAFQRNEQIAGLQRARIDGHARRGERRVACPRVAASASAEVQSALMLPPPPHARRARSPP